VAPLFDTDIYRRARRECLATGDVDPTLLKLLVRAVAALVHARGLPPMYSPVGHWSRDAKQEVLADWLEARLLARGELRAILAEADTPERFVAIGERSLRNHLINRLPRTQARNLYGNVRKLLEGGDYDLLHAAKRPQDAAWGPKRSGLSPWAGSDDELAAHAWSLGDFETVVYRDDAKKLSPLLEAPELRRFVDGLQAATGCALTPSDVMRALKARFPLDDVEVSSLDDRPLEPASATSVVEEVAAADLARAVIAELESPRQAEVLRGQLGHQTVRESAAELSVSAGTVSAERAKITAVLRRVADPDGDSRTLLLNALRDLLFTNDKP
jgi:hypothetical protein